MRRTHAVCPYGMGRNATLCRCIRRVPASVVDSIASQACQRVGSTFRSCRHGDASAAPFRLRRSPTTGKDAWPLSGWKPVF